MRYKMPIISVQLNWIYDILKSVAHKLQSKFSQIATMMPIYNACKKSASGHFGPQIVVRFANMLIKNALIFHRKVRAIVLLDFGNWPQKKQPSKLPVSFEFHFEVFESFRFFFLFSLWIWLLECSTFQTSFSLLLKKAFFSSFGSSLQSKNE